MRRDNSFVSFHKIEIAPTPTPMVKQSRAQATVTSAQGFLKHFAFIFTRRVAQWVRTISTFHRSLAFSAMDEQLLDQVRAYVEHYMSKYDASHDYNHILRVYKLAKTIEAQEQKLNPKNGYRSDLVTLASLLHDVGDKKYLKPGEDGTTMVKEFLLGFGADQALAVDVQTVVNHVSFSTEVKDPAKVHRCLEQYPELGIVQDADRLDAIGAIGIGRCFTYTGAAGKGSLDNAIDHFQEKLLKLEGMMKTETGKGMARVRSQRLNEFRFWWMDEVGLQENGSIPI